MQKRGIFLGLCLVLLAPSRGADIRLQGLPLQVEWFDVNGDGLLDVVALMLISQTEGQLNTYYEAGRLRGIYEDETFKEKYLATFLAGNGGWTEAHRAPLGRETILGFALEHARTSRLMLWTRQALIHHEWTDAGWIASRRVETPGLLAREGVYMSEFLFWQTTPEGSYWLVPDLDGLHLLPADEDRGQRFLPYPDLAFERTSLDSGRHQIELAMPRLLSLDQDPSPELVFQGNELMAGFSLENPETTYQGDGKGVLIDLNGDGMADLIEIEVDDEIERKKDLPRVTSHVKTYMATGPLTFSEEPRADQSVPGFVINNEDSEINLAEPFLDLNGDGLIDLAGIAFKFSMFQIAKLVTVGRFTMKFLLNLSMQQEDGSFHVLAGGPFEMAWTLNIRRLRLPSFAQMTADFDGDGWIDILMEKGNKLQVTPLAASGFQNARTWTQKIPSDLRKPDQVFGKDLNGDGKAEFVLMKVRSNQTLLGVLEHGR